MFERICADLGLGKLTASPVNLSGGFTHRMFRMETEKGTYAVKLLNPEIMARTDALTNYSAAEKGEALLEAAELPILPALTIGGQKMQCIGGAYLYVFEYYDGRVLTDEEITPAHCAKVGAALAGIHAVKPLAYKQAADSVAVERHLWGDLAADLLASTDVQAEGQLLQAAVLTLTQVAAAAERAARSLPQMSALCHNDMDPKNVLWRGTDFRIIDLECVGEANPQQEMLDLAITWSNGREAQFKAFVEAYMAAGGIPITDAASVYDSRRNYIDWLAYNARRALAEDAQERRIAREQIRWTIEKIRSDAERRNMILGWLQALSAP